MPSLASRSLQGEYSSDSLYSVVVVRGGEVRGCKLRPLPVRAVARNCSFRFENSFISFKASFSEALTRLGCPTLTRLIDFSCFIPTFFLLRFIQSMGKTLLLLRRHKITTAAAQIEADAA